MLKLRYDEITGVVGNAYSDEIDVPIPFVEVTSEFHDTIKTDENNLYFYVNGEFVKRPKKEIEQEEYWKKNFFNTSLGWVRREPTLADGTKDNFLNNDLPLFAIALSSGTPAYLPIAYFSPDYTQDFSEEYFKTLQIRNQIITPNFINECMAVKMSDFTG